VCASGSTPPTTTSHGGAGALQPKQAQVTQSGVAVGTTVKWFIAAAVGVLCGFMASIVDWIIMAVDSWRFEAAHYLLAHHRASDGDARAFFAYMAVALSMAAAAATICAFVEPLAAGSGIPVSAELPTAAHNCSLPYPLPERGSPRVRTRALCVRVTVHSPYRPHHRSSRRISTASISPVRAHSSSPAALPSQLPPLDSPRHPSLNSVPAAYVR
jgi:hypothetical protein